MFFSKEYILYVEGEGAVVIPEMMNNFIFDHVFYTGSTATGKLIYKMAAEKLVPVTLELGGKCPCVVESDANINSCCKTHCDDKIFKCRANVCSAGLCAGASINKRTNL